MKTVYHADLSDADAGEDYWLHACGKRYPLLPHTEHSRAAAKAASPSLAALPDHRLTHYTQEPADLPADRVVRVHIKHTLRNQPNAKGNAGLGTVAIHVPPPQALTGAHATAATASHVPIDYVTTAKALVFHHPDLVNATPEVSRILYDYMDNNQAIKDQFETLAMQMREMCPPGENSGWATLQPYTPPASDLRAGDGKTTPIDGKTTYYIAQPTPEVMASAGNVTTAMMLATKNDMGLAGKKWTLQTGTAVQPVSSEEVRLSLAARIQACAGDNWQAALGSTNTAHGLDSTIKVLDASKRQIQLTMNNTYIRYLGVPAFMLAFGAAMQSYKPLYDLVNGLMSDSRFLTALGIGGTAWFGYQFGTKAANKQMNWQAFSSLMQVLFNPAATRDPSSTSRPRQRARQRRTRSPSPAGSCSPSTLPLALPRWPRPSSRWRPRPGTSRTRFRPRSPPPSTCVRIRDIARSRRRRRTRARA